MNVRTKPYSNEEKLENLEKLASYLEKLPEDYEQCTS